MYCSRSCANSRNFSEETNLKKSISAKTSIKAVLATKNLNRNSIGKDSRCRKSCQVCRKEFLTYRSTQKFCSLGCSLKGRNPSGGCREGSGRSKTGWYRGYYCGSSWELAWVIYHIDHEIEFERNTEGFDYQDETGRTRKYYPDFKYPNHQYIEVKGYWSRSLSLKLKSFPHPIDVLFKEQLASIFEYVHSKYGKDFIKLYEGNPHNQKKNLCEICGQPARKIYCSQLCSGKAVRLKRSAQLLCGTNSSVL